LLACFVRALKALSLHLKHVLLAFCSLGRRQSESFFGQDPLQREEARSRYAAPRAPGERGVSNHESHSAMAPNIMSLWLRLQSGGVLWV
jgi:hypothetical protein